MSKEQNIILPKIRKFGIGSVIFLIFITIVITSAPWYKHILTNQKSEKNLISDLQTTNKNLFDRIELLKTQPPDTSQDAVLERDIFIYIDKRYQLIPKTTSLDIAKQIVIKSRELEISPELVVGIIEVESAFNPSAVSSANARGLMQVMPEWASKFGLEKVSDLHDIDTGIECGIKVLKIHIEEEKGNVTKGLFRYVGGSDAYAGKVYTAIGKFVTYRSTIPDTEEKQE